MMNASAVPVPACTRIEPPLTSTDTPGDSTDRVRMMTPKPESDRVKAGGCVVWRVCCSDMKRPLSSRDDLGVIRALPPKLGNIANCASTDLPQGPASHVQGRRWLCGMILRACPAATC